MAEGYFIITVTLFTLSEELLKQRVSIRADLQAARPPSFSECRPYNATDVSIFPNWPQYCRATQ